MPTPKRKTAANERKCILLDAIRNELNAFVPDPNRFLASPVGRLRDDRTVIRRPGEE